MSELVQILQHGQVRELRMDRAPVNALDDALCAALLHALQAAFDDDVAGIVLAGNARVFSAGLDVPYLLSLGDDRAALYRTWDAFFKVAGMLAHAPMPVAAALTGHAPAGGCVLALCCDYRVMARGADPARSPQIGLNEVQVGLCVPEGIQHLMRRVVGAQRAERMFVAGTMASAEQAAAIGLVDALADDAPAAIAQALAWAQAMASLPRAPMRKTRGVARADVRAALDSIALDDFVDDWYLPDAQTALQAMVARLRKP
jgi:enoyl-CoA hydratase/carnithine racemase